MKRLAILILALFVASCAGPNPQPAPPIAPPAAKISTPECARAVQQTLVAVTPKLAAVKTSIDSLTPENVVAVKPVLQSQFAYVMQDFSDLTVKGGKVELLQTSVAADVDAHNVLIKTDAAKDKKIAALEAADPVKAWFEIIGGALTALGLTVIVLSFLPWTLWAAPFRGIAISAVIVGFVLLTLATFLRLTEIVIGIALGVGFIIGVAWLAYYIWQHRKALAIATDVVQSIDKGKAAGQIVFTAAATDPKTSIVKAFQSDATAAFVNAVQGKPAPNLASPANAPGNVATANGFMAGNVAAK